MKDKTENNTTNKKNLNFLLFYLTFLAGCLWWLIGESILIGAGKSGTDALLRNPLLNGLYFAFLALFTLLACFISERFVHSIVSEDFFNWAVKTPALKKILLTVFIAMFLVSGVLEFLYEIEPVKSAPKPRTPPKTVQTPVNREIMDYYFLLDNSDSMWSVNDRNNERTKLLKKLVDDISEEHQIALVTFDHNTNVGLFPQNADQDTKSNFKNALDELPHGGTTDIKKALVTLASLINTPASHKGSVVFISDGEDINGFTLERYDFGDVMAPYIRDNIPINTVFLNPNNIYAATLREISQITGGTFSTVNDPLQLEAEVANTIKDTEEKVSVTANNTLTAVTSDPLRDDLSNRAGKQQKSPFYAIFHILIITIIGLLLGYFIYTMFSHRDVKRPMLIGGSISGLLAGLVLEFGMQNPSFSPALIRMFSCVILSTVIWGLSFLSEGIGVIWDYHKKGHLRELFARENAGMPQNNDMLAGNHGEDAGGGTLEDKTKKPEEDSKDVLK
jgi:Ca-activated chloride channel family protein